MTKYFAGNSLAALARTSAGLIEITTAGRFDSAYVPSAVLIPSGSSNASVFAQTAAFSHTGGSLFTRFDSRHDGSSYSSSSSPLVWLVNGGVNVFRIIGVTSSTMQGEYWNGSAWVATGSTLSFSDATLRTLLLRIDLGSGFELFANGASILSGSGWAGSPPNTITNVRFGCFVAAGAGHSVSQVMVADYDIGDDHLMHSALNGNSAANTGAASGVFTDVNETVLNDATAISITASANKAGQTHAGITLPGGYVIAAAVVAARGRQDGVITDGKLGIRSGGANYSSAAKSYGTSYSPRVDIVENDPATAAIFTQSGFNSAEPYLEAA